MLFARKLSVHLMDALYPTLSQNQLRTDGMEWNGGKCNWQVIIFNDVKMIISPPCVIYLSKHQDSTIYPFFLLMLHVLLPVSTFVSLKAGFYDSVAYKKLSCVFSLAF